MEESTLEKANQINRDINKIKEFADFMDGKVDSFYEYLHFREDTFPKELKDILRPILKEYQDKLFCQLKNL